MKNLILNFSDIYPRSMEEWGDLEWVDCSDIRETDLYCSPQAQSQIWKRLLPFGGEGVHFIDSGNYHYMTELFLEMERMPFSLVLFDHHSDMQPVRDEMRTETGGYNDRFLSCGGWVRDVIMYNPMLRHVTLIGASVESVAQIGEDVRDVVTCFSVDEWDDFMHSHEEERTVDIGDIYVSVDKDVLSARDAVTNWDQGDMSLELLLKSIDWLKNHYRIIGADICGEAAATAPVREQMNAALHNEKANHLLYELLDS